MFLCCYEGRVGQGKTLREAHDDLCNNYHEIGPTECDFYEVGKPLVVEVMIVKKEVIV